MARYIAMPRGVLEAAIAEMPGWKHLAEKAFDNAKELCPVSEDTGDPRAKPGPHLRETLRLKMITGADPRILIGSDTKGDVLDFVHTGTSAHEIPVPSGTLAFTPRGEGQVIFRKVDSVTHPGTTANPFIIEAMKRALGNG